MARVRLPKTAFTLRGGSLLALDPGAQLYVYQRGTTTQVTGYTTESGSTQVTYPLTANAEGKFDAWYAPGSYDLYSPVDGDTEPWEALGASDLIVEGDSAGGALSGSYPNPGLAGGVDLAAWSAASNPDIDGLLPGSTSGALLRSPANAHLTVGLRDNDPNDSFAVLSGGGNWNTDSLFDTVVFCARADGRVGLGTGSPGSALHLTSDAGTAASGIQFGSDVSLYRSAANVLKTDDRLDAADGIIASGDGPTVDGVAAAILAQPDTTADANGVVVKAPDSTWGTGAYGTGQAFMLLREDYAGGAELEPDRNVLFRVSGYDGGIGTCGGIHIATGLRKHAGQVFTHSAWIDPSEDLIGLIIDAGIEAPTKDFLQARTASGAMRAKIDQAGKIIAHPGAATEVRIGDEVGYAAVVLGGDSALYRFGPSEISTGTGDSFLVQEKLTVNPGAASPGITINAASNTPTQDYLRARKLDGTSVAKIDSIGKVVAHPGAANEVQVGDIVGFPGIVFGSDAALYRSGANVVATAGGDAFKISDSWLEMDEVTEPAAPAADHGRLFMRDNGAGKTQLCVKFNTGAVQVIATQP